MRPHNDEFLDLFLANQSSLYAILIAGGVASTDLDDVLQQLALLIWEKFDQFEQGTNFRAWAFAFARNLLQRYHAASARQARVRPLPADLLDALATLEVTGHPELISDRAEHLKGCLDRLHPDARRLIAWRYGDRLSFDDLAARAGRSSQALRTKLSRIRRVLRDCIELHMRQATQP